MKTSCFVCGYTIDVTSAIYVHDAPMCATCWRIESEDAFERDTGRTTDERNADERNAENVVGIAR